MKDIYNLILINVMYVAAYFAMSGFIFDNWSWRSGLTLRRLRYLVLVAAYDENPDSHK